MAGTPFAIGAAGGGLGGLFLQVLADSLSLACLSYGTTAAGVSIYPLSVFALVEVLVFYTRSCDCGRKRIGLDQQRSSSDLQVQIQDLTKRARLLDLGSLDNTAGDEDVGDECSDSCC